MIFSKPTFSMLPIFRISIMMMVGRMPGSVT